MCEPRYWKSFFAYENKGCLIVGGVRSDNQIFKIHTPELDNSITSIYPILIEAIKELESYRSCKCELNKPCDKHKEQK